MFIKTNGVPTTYALNEWGSIGQEIVVGIGKSATSNLFEKSCCSGGELERSVLSNPNSSYMALWRIFTADPENSPDKYHEL